MNVNRNKGIKICKAILPIILCFITCASECEEIQRFKESLDKSIEMATVFAENTDILEYTAIRAEGTRKNLQDTYEFCSNVLFRNNPDDLVTVIQMKTNAESLEHDDLIYGLTKFLQSYAAEGNGNDYFTKNLQLRAHVIKDKFYHSLYAAAEDVDCRRHIHDIMQWEMNTLVNNIVTQKVKHFTPFAILKAFGYSFRQIFHEKNSIPRLTMNEKNQRYLIKLMRNLNSEHFRYQVTRAVMAFFTENQDHIQSIADKIMDYQKSQCTVIYEHDGIKNLVSKFWNSEMNTCVENHLNSIYDQITKKIWDSNSINLVGMYDWYVRKISQEYVVRKGTDRPDTIFTDAEIEEFVLSNDYTIAKSNDAFFREIDLDSIISKYKKINTTSLLYLKPAYNHNSIRIICNETINQRNIQYLCHILYHMDFTLNLNLDQAIFINMREGLCTRSILCRVGHFFEQLYDSNNAPNFDQAGAKLDLTVKCSGDMFLRKSTFKFSYLLEAADVLASQNTNAFYSELCEILEQNVSMKTLFDNAKVRNKYIQKRDYYQIFADRRLKLDDLLVDTLQIEIENRNEICTIQISPNKMKETAEKEQTLLKIHVEKACRGNTLEENTERIISKTNGKYQIHILQSLLQQLVLAQLMPGTSEMPCFLKKNLRDNCYTDELILPVYQKWQDKYDLSNTCQLELVCEAIQKFYRKNVSFRNIYSTTFTVQSYLKRNNTIEFRQILGEFCSYISVGSEKIMELLENHLIDYDRINAINGFRQSNYSEDKSEIKLIVIGPFNDNTLVYIARKELERDLNIDHSSDLLNIYSCDFHEKNTDSFAAPKIRYSFPFDQIHAHPHQIILQTMHDLGFFKCNFVRLEFHIKEKEFFNSLQHQFNALLHDRMFLSADLTFTPLIDTKKLKLFDLCLKRFFESETELVLRKVKDSIKKRAKTAIKVTAIYLREPKEKEMQIISEVDHQLQELICYLNKN